MERGALSFELYSSTSAWKRQVCSSHFLPLDGEFYCNLAQLLEFEVPCMLSNIRMMVALLNDVFCHACFDLIALFDSCSVKVLGMDFLFARLKLVPLWYSSHSVSLTRAYRDLKMEVRS